MKQTPALQKKPWKTWHKVFIGFVIFFIFLMFIVTRNIKDAPAGPPLSQQQKDSIARIELITKQFSSWDGSHTNLVNYVKQNMNDPKSFEHVKTVYWDFGKKITVKMTYRGKNGFGGLVVGTVIADTKTDGTIIDVKQQ